MPAISVITANHNKGAIVAETVRSVCAQQFPDWEYLFIDDHSEDESLKIAREAADGDERCRFLSNPTGQHGANAARNLGISEARAPYLMFLDSDDLLTPEALGDRLADFADYPDADLLAYPMGVFFDRIGDSELISNIPTDEGVLDRFLNRDPVWLISGPTWKRAFLEKLGGFDRDLASQQDMDLHIRALIAGARFRYFHKKPNVYYRRNVVSLARQNSQSLSHLRQRMKMLSNHLRLLDRANMLTPGRRLTGARQMLDLAQMMRWHIAELGAGVLEEAQEFWKTALENNLIDENTFRIARRYLRFKHNMWYNRFPRLQQWQEKRYQSRLEKYIFRPSATHLKMTLADYED